MPTILIVDDDEGVRQVTAMLCRNEGWGVVEAVDGEEALARANDPLVDLIVLDNYMPGLSGMQVLGRLAAKGISQRVPVLFLTAADDGVTRRAALLAGASDFIGKPINWLEFLTRARRLLEWGRLRRESDEVRDRTRETLHTEQLSVAVVDDDPLFSKYAKVKLNHGFAEVCLFSSGQEFLDAVQGGMHYDAALIDLMMPSGLSGFDTLCRLRLLPAGGSVATVLLSSADATDPAWGDGWRDADVVAVKGHIDLQHAVESAICKRTEAIDRHSADRLDHLEGAVRDLALKWGL